MSKKAGDPTASSRAPLANPGTLAALALILTGLGVPPIIDGVEAARGLDIPREGGVLPWLVLDALGLGLLVWSLTPRKRRRPRPPLGRRLRRRSLIWAALASVGALEIPLLVWPGVVAALKAAPPDQFYRAMAGHWAVAAGLGLLVFAGLWYKGGGKGTGAGEEADG